MRAEAGQGFNIPSASMMVSTRVVFDASAVLPGRQRQLSCCGNYDQGVNYLAIGFLSSQNYQLGLLPENRPLDDFTFDGLFPSAMKRHSLKRSERCGNSSHKANEAE